MQIFVRGDSTFSLRVQPATNVGRLNRLVHERLGEPQRLVFAGKQLDNEECTLADYGVGAGSTLHAVGRLPGGCGVVGVILADENKHVNQMIFDALTVLQHRGQDAAGMVTCEQKRLHLRKDNGLVQHVFTQEAMIQLRGPMGIGHCRYPTAGTSSCAEAQPLYTNFPYGLCIAHNGNLTNASTLKHSVEAMCRHVNTNSDSELLLNIFSESLAKVRSEGGDDLDSDAIFYACSSAFKKCIGGYAVAILINDVGVVVFRDPLGIRPLIYGSREQSHGLSDYAISSESVAIDTITCASGDTFDIVRDVAPGEAIFFPKGGRPPLARQCVPGARLCPCLFEYVYFARPDSVMDGVPVVEEYFGDLKALEGLSKAVLEGSAAAARILFLVNPNGLTRARDVTQTKNGTAIAGRPDDVIPLQMNKQADMSVAMQTAATISERLSFAFLMNSAVQRQGERVTAEEVRYMAGELEDALGGVYSILSQEYQLPYVMRIIDRMTRAKKLPALPKGVAQPTITTGLEALGRGHDLNKYDMFLKALMPLGPEVLSQYMNVGDYITRIGTSLGLDLGGLVKSEEQLQQERAQAEQQQQMQQMMEMAKPAIGPAAKAGTEAIAQAAAQGQGDQ